MPSVKSLFGDITRTTGKSSDKKLAQRVNAKSRVATPTIKGGGGLLDRIATINSMVDKHLGKYREEYQIIQTEEALHEFVDNVIDCGIVSIDTETTGLDPMQDTIAGICVYSPNQKSSYIPLNHISYITEMTVPNQLPPDLIRSEFQRFLDAKVQIIMFNADFDIRVLRHGIALKDIYCTWDCYLAQWLLNENEDSNALKKVHQKYVLDGKEDAFTFDEFFKGIPFTMIPLQTAYLYAAHDPIITYELYEYQHRFIREDSPREDMQKIYKLFTEIEMPCVPVVADMEDNGILFDFEYNAKLKEKYHKLLDEREEDFHKSYSEYSQQVDAYRNKYGKLDKPINIKSTDQLAILLYDIMGCEPFYDKRKKKVVRTTSAEYLAILNNKVTHAILRYREFSTIVDTFIDKMPNCVNPKDNRVHCKFNQYGARTGRFSSENPNMQNIPSHNKDIRKMFTASPGYVLMSSDFSQQEPKALAALCRMDGDSQMYDTFMRGKDLYSEIASKAFNRTYEECLEHNADGTTNAEGKERRSQAKSILLGVLYGRGVASIAEQLNCTVEKAQAIKDSVFRAFPAIKRFEDDSLNMAYELGYVTTVCGRKRRLPDLTLDEYEFKWENGHAPNDDLLDFDSDEEQEIPERTIRKYLTMLHKCKFKDKQKVFEKANDEGIWIVDNGGKIADASRQCVNSRIQGSAADLTKLAMVYASRNERLKELGFRLLIQVHDELIGECPEENMKECSELLAKVMSESAEKILEMPVKCDVDLMYQWYGEKVDGSKRKEKESQTSHAMDAELRKSYGNK